LNLSAMGNRWKLLLARSRGSWRDDGSSLPRPESAVRGVRSNPESAGLEPAGEAKADRSHSARRINRIAALVNAQRYLEIGVAHGRTFRNVTIGAKVGVDPKFRFDLESLRRAGSVFHEMTSDEYFRSHAGLAKFDLIFLDGLHQFRQSFRDFCNSLLCAHDGTIWVIDDVVPSDVYSAWPVMHESLDFRRRSGDDARRVWHGDVFKLVFAIHDFFPMLSYATVVGSGNPQTLVWRARRAKFSPAFESLEAIERLEYFEMLKRFDLFNATSEEEAVSALLKTRKRRSMHVQEQEPKALLSSKSSPDVRIEEFSKRPVLSRTACEIAIRQRTRLARYLSDEYHRLMQQEFESIESVLPRHMKNLLDIGAGIGGIHLFTYAHAAGQVNIHMLDKDRVDPVMRYGFRETTEAYNSIAESRRYLSEGGVPAERLFYWNAADEGEMARLKNFGRRFEAVMSLKSWCFHYPAETYAELVGAVLAPNGVLVVDIRKATSQEAELSPYFSSHHTLYEDNKCRRVCFLGRK